MKPLAHVLAMILAVLASCHTGIIDVPDPDPGPGNETAPRMALGYFTGSQASFDAIASFHTYLTMVSTDVFVVTSTGDVSGEISADVVAYDRANGIQTFACISNYGTSGFDSQLAHDAIATYKDQVIAGMVDLAKRGSFDGINVDFEAIYPADRDLFTQFIGDLATALHAQGFELIISVPAKTEDSADNDWGWPFDYAPLGRSADLIQLMTYDEHGPWSNPGSVAGRPWMESCVKYAALVIDPKKLLIGLPAYGYDWDLANSDNDTSFSWKNVPALLSRTGATPVWDAVSQSAQIAYTNNADRHNHQAWYETSESIRLKTELVADYGLAGVSMWALGKEDADFWSAVGVPK